MKKIGIIGSGAVAKALGDGFLKHNYEVMLGSRYLSKITPWKESAGEKGHIGSPVDAAKFGEIVVIAVKGSVAVNVLEEAGPQNLQKKTVIDATNPIADSAPEDGVIKFFTNHDESLMERLQTQFPEVHFVKAFNSVGNGVMVDPQFNQKPTMFICGNNQNAKKDTTEILEKFGWEVADMGKATSARAIEPLCMLWCIPAINNGEISHAFKLIKM
ncbi:MAG: NAD(P)-binding domain-containing protein [Taibaiella sp.]|nr:NAD(P)-binding domain-containing protein [Taibaiella sp.]